MLKSDKNKLFNYLKKSFVNIDTIDFVDEYDKTKIVIKDSEYSFSIYSHNSKYELYSVKYIKFTRNHSETYYIPSSDFPSYLTNYVIRDSYSNYIDIEGVLEVLKYWVDNDLKKYFEEKDTIDEWELYKQGNKLLDTNYEHGQKEKFSDEKLKELKIKLNEFKLYILSEYNPNKEQLEKIEEKIDYLITASLRNTIFDWKNIAMTVLLNIASDLMLDHTNAISLFNYFKSLFITILFLH